MEAISKVLFGKEGMPGLHQQSKESETSGTTKHETQVSPQEQVEEASPTELMEEAMTGQTKEDEQQESIPSVIASEAKEKLEQFMPSSGSMSEEEKQESSDAQTQTMEQSEQSAPRTSATEGALEPATTSVPPSDRESKPDEQHHKVRITYPLKDLPGSLPTAVSLLSDIDDWQNPLDMMKADEEFFADIDVPTEVGSKKKVTYKFLCDGQWTTNPLLATQADEKGNMNHVLEV